MQAVPASLIFWGALALWSGCYSFGNFFSLLALICSRGSISPAFVCTFGTVEKYNCLLCWTGPIVCERCPSNVPHSLCSCSYKFGNIWCSGRVGTGRPGFNENKGSPSIAGWLLKFSLEISPFQPKQYSRSIPKFIEFVPFRGEW